MKQNKDLQQNSDQRLKFEISTMVCDSKKKTMNKKDIPPLLILSCLQEKMKVSEKNKKKKRERRIRGKRWKWT